MAESIAGTRVALVLATSTGGVGQHVRSLADHLTAHGAVVRILGPAATAELFGYDRDCFRPVEIASGLRPAADTLAARALRTHTVGADVVHAHGLRAGLVSALAGLGRSTPLVVTWHNLVLGHATGTRRILGALERVIARSTDVTLCVSPDLVSRVLSLGARDARLAPVVPPPLPAAARPAAQVRAELGAEGRPLVLCLARLHHQKGLDVLVAAARKLAAADPPPLVVVAGEGPQRPDLERQIAASAAPVRLLGRRDDVADLLAAADVVAFPSRWEGSSLAQQETLRAGRPLVATSVGGVPALVGDAGLLVAPDNPDALADALTRVLTDPELAADLGRRGTERAATWPTEEQVARQVQAVYRELLGPA